MDPIGVSSCEPVFIPGSPTTLVGSPEIWHPVVLGPEGVQVPDYQWIKRLFFGGFICPLCWIYVIIRVPRLWYIESRYLEKITVPCDCTINLDHYSLENGERRYNHNNNHDRENSYKPSADCESLDFPSHPIYYFEPTQYRKALAYLNKAILAMVTYAFMIFIIVYGLAWHSGFESAMYSDSGDKGVVVKTFEKIYTR
ncbi:hypothetical protein NADFUDRAFT_43365 [Nadsonia fulvescens var. elongata DSM 6958]|uniref:Uncharacterized protein n=1 Tax=Nadsonia fulvescens var. elongata DSM 6958 TaxID=857566 RepID=A0A1E3PG18_9ASCO|nr:hypothetical protein NADFUDRAFT_43365 [Nadsonia fulvescens var. elongata DSM 6958]